MSDAPNLESSGVSILGSHAIDFSQRLNDDLAANDPAPHVMLVRASTIKPEPIDWLWPGWLARGKVHILAGAPGAGKTTLAIDLAAAISSGGRLPGGHQPAKGSIVIWSGEDDPKDTLVPRLMMAGADLQRVAFVSGVIEKGRKRSFDPACDIPFLRDAMMQMGDVRLLLVDPIVSAVAGDSHKNAEVRRGLQPLADLAQRAGAALLGISHMSKGTSGRDPVERLNGSLAFGAVARIVMLASKQRPKDGDDPMAEKPRLLMRAKSNIGPDSGGFEYTLKDQALPGIDGVTASRVSWGGALTASARELLADAEAEPEPGDGFQRREARDFLSDALAGGPMMSKQLRAEANDAGISWTTIKRAQKELGIKPRKTSGTGGWEWALPDEPG